MALGFDRRALQPVDLDAERPARHSHLRHHQRRRCLHLLGVELDGVYTPFNGETGDTGDALGWGKGVVLDNVQIDGYGSSGSATVYMDKLTVYRW
jgi:hypothetical protein